MEHHFFRRRVDPDQVDLVARRGRRTLPGRAAGHRHMRLVERHEVLGVQGTRLSAVGEADHGGLAAGKVGAGREEDEERAPHGRETHVGITTSERQS